MQPLEQTVKIELIYPNQRSIQAILQQGDYLDSSGEENRLLILRYEGREISAGRETQWHCLCAIRVELENEGILLRCYGASRNVYPSGMCLSMGEGSVAYRTYLGQAARTKDLVGIFCTGPDVVPATLKEQADFHWEWMNGFKAMR